MENSEIFIWKREVEAVHTKSKIWLICVMATMKNQHVVCKIISLRLINIKAHASFDFYCF